MCGKAWEAGSVGSHLTVLYIIKLNITFSCLICLFVSLVSFVPSSSKLVRYYETIQDQESLGISVENTRRLCLSWRLMSDSVLDTFMSWKFA